MRVVSETKIQIIFKLVYDFILRLSSFSPQYKASKALNNICCFERTVTKTTLCAWVGLVRLFRERKCVISRASAAEGH